MSEVTSGETSHIQWDRFETDFVSMETGVARNLKLSNWQQGTWFDMPGLQFHVLEEDSKPTEKVFRTTSKRLVRELKPIIQKAQKDGRSVISVSITRMGDGLNTTYEVRENA